jgi:hypothetical protein
MTSACLELANWESLPVAEKTMSETSASQSTESSSAFLNSPRRRFENVTCRAAALSIRRISRAISLSLDAAPPPLLLARKKRRGRARPLASHMRNPPEAPAGYTRAYSSTPRQEKGGCLLLGSWRVGFRRRVQ